MFGSWSQNARKFNYSIAIAPINFRIGNSHTLPEDYQILEFSRHPVNDLVLKTLSSKKVITIHNSPWVLLILDVKRSLKKIHDLVINKNCGNLLLDRTLPEAYIFSEFCKHSMHIVVMI